MKRLRIYAIIIFVVFAAAGMAVVVSHNHWDTRIIDSGGDRIYCHYLKNPPVRNAAVLIVPPMMHVMVSLAIIALAERSISCVPGLYFMPDHSDPFVSALTPRAPPAR